MGFAYEVRVVDYLTSHGARALSGRRYSTTSLQGLNWVIKPTQVCIAMNPQEVNSRTLMDGRISLSFNNYVASTSTRQPSYNERDEEIQSDEETFQTLAVLIEQAPGVFVACNDEYPEETHQQEAFEEYEDAQPYVLVHKIYSLAKIPKKKSKGAAGFDLAASESCVIVARGKGKIPTGLQIEIPWGSYERIATRSSAAWNLGIDIGAGVIDSDYRDIYEAPSLTQTSRGDGGFGSTSKALQQSPPIFSKILPKEKHMISVLFEEHSLPQEGREENHAGDISPRPLYSAITTPMEDPRQPIWDSYSDDDEDWINPFATEGESQSLLYRGIYSSRAPFLIASTTVSEINVDLLHSQGSLELEAGFHHRRRHLFSLIHRTTTP
ncbi:hypothetical protein ZIOFF_005710 [Zingiber officinale]|uniref:Deoxyuridine 5'-triphosphate nucleotidohydrolase n=1 Tax=Zingiber officinale TaxID=94328 RepID=A0A8J5HXE5_ZINOF|nr:hypothetical protein ZIOFF_005710 [Zingiber officinale]